MRLAPWSAALERPFLRFWNRCFASRRNFIPLTSDLLRDRVLGGGVPGERFEARGLILALEGREIAGLVHAVRRSATVSRRLDPGWPGGTRGIVAFLFVDPARRRRGIGDRLWHAAGEYLRGTRQVVLDGQCQSPFWGNAYAPRTPLWGNPEGVGVDWDDSATKKFLARKGFVPRWKAMHLDRRLDEGGLPAVRGETRFLAGIPDLGGAPGRLRRLRGGSPVETAVKVARGRVRGLVAYFEMPEVRKGLYAIYEGAVVPSERGGPLGPALLGAALGRIRERGGREVEVLTVPEVAPHAHGVYLAAGFRQAAAWAVY